ncbi:hypothetical protein FS749_002041 [Ceratobasidium sp. UAMH 11750]|nr:hypothetical protein FS749_002041 [Ceratobasidium sp. UAMH 11750]
MPNGTLYDYIHLNPEAERWALCTQVAEGLEYIHSIGMIHGDLKASNILISIEGVVKLGDFGNSVLADYSLVFSVSNIAGGGTTRWMAPELFGQEDVDAADRDKKTDVYALGMAS